MLDKIFLFCYSDSFKNWIGPTGRIGGYTGSNYISDRSCN